MREPISSYQEGLILWVMVLQSSHDLAKYLLALSLSQLKDILVKIIYSKVGRDQENQDHCQFMYSLFSFEMKVVIDSASSPTMETRLAKGFLLGR